MFVNQYKRYAYNILIREKSEIKIKRLGIEII